MPAALLPLILSMIGGIGAQKGAGWLAGKFAPQMVKKAPGWLKWLGGTGAFVGGMGATDVLLGESEAPELPLAPTVDDIRPSQWPNRAEEQQGLARVQQETQLRQLLETMGVDYDELMNLSGGLV